MVRHEGHVRGELSEFKMASNLVENGCRVSYTHGQYPYDLIGDLDGELFKIQVKTAKKDKNRTRKYQITPEGYDAVDVDFFAGYAPGEDNVFYVPFGEVDGRFAVTFTKSDDLSDINVERAILAEDYTFEKVISEHR